MRDVGANWTWENVWTMLCFLLAIAGIAIAITAITSDHKIKGYYAWRSRSGGTPCIWVDMDWTPDDVVYCTNDQQQLLDMLNKLNATVKK